VRCSLAFLGAWLLFFRPLAAQTSADSVPDSLRIDEVRVVTHDIFTAEEAKGLIPKLANGLHWKTRPWVVRREVLLREGEAYDSARAAETERNLRALRVFRRVRVDSARAESGALRLEVETQDAFTTRTDFAFRRSGGGRSGLIWSVGMTERNLFGTATALGVRYRDTPDRTAVLFTGTRQRLFANRVGMAAIYDDRSDGRLAWLSVFQPFYSFSTTGSWYASGEERQERILRFREGGADPSSILQRRYWLTSAGVSFAPIASPKRYLRVSITGHLKRDDYADEIATDTLAHSMSGTVGAVVQWRRARFLVAQNVEGFGRDEDVDLSTVLQAGLNLTPRAFGYRDNGLVPSVQARTGIGFDRGFVRLAMAAHARISETGWVDSGSVHVGALAVVQPKRQHLAVLYAGQGWQRNPMPGGEFDLGLVVGPRGFGSHEFTGDRAFFASAEYRYTIAEEVFRSAGVGLAAFADYGGAWFAGSERRTGYSVGLGLRFGVTIDSGLEPLRVDLARVGGSGLDRGRWELAIGKGFVFDSQTLRLDR